MVSLSFHFNGHLPCGPGLASTRMCPFWILLVLRAIETCKAPVKTLPPTEQHPYFYTLDAISVAQLTLSKD